MTCAGCGKEIEEGSLCEECEDFDLDFRSTPSSPRAGDKQ